MRSRNFTHGASAILLLTATIVEAKHGHAAAHDALQAIHRRHKHNREIERASNESLEAREVSCAFPAGLGLVSVTPSLGNGGWAFAPDQTCGPGRYCPYACPPGQVSMQWDPDATSYSYPKSRNGGLLCGNDGTLTKPFPDRPYCQATAQNIGVQNTCGSPVTFCQTVLPGDEDMLIPTVVNDFASLAVPDPNYWASTAAHYYINPPGTNPADACTWGSNAKPLGNWSPFVAGANADASGQTFIKLGWNPIYLEAATPFRNELPDWGVKIECPGGDCGGLPCAIDPAKNVVNQMIGSAVDGAGGGAFCVVTVPKGSKANFVVFKAGQSDAKTPGQFFQSSTTQTTLPSTTTTSTLTTTKTTPTQHTTPSALSVGRNTTAGTSSVRAGPTHYSLFDSQSATQATGSTSAYGVASTPTAPVSQHKNSAAGSQVSAGLLVMAVAMALL